MEIDHSRSIRAFQYCIIVSSIASCFCLFFFQLTGSIPIYGAVLLSISIIPTWGLHGYLSAAFDSEKQDNTKRPGCGTFLVVIALGIGIGATFIIAIWSAGPILYIFGLLKLIIVADQARGIILLYQLIVTIGVVVWHIVIPYWGGAFLCRAKEKSRRQEQEKYLDALIEWP